jgi:esterase/lipase superfamily enzyme
MWHTSFSLSCLPDELKLREFGPNQFRCIDRLLTGEAMASNDTTLFLELLRDNFDEIQVRCRDDWPNLAEHIRVLLAQLAGDNQPNDVIRLGDELLRLLRTSGAADYVEELLADQQRLLDENTRSSPPQFHERHFPTEADDAGTETAAGLMEWLPERDRTYRSVEVFFATDRKATDEDNLNKYFGSARGQLSYGAVRVSIPDRHATGHIERPLTWFPESPARHVALLDITQTQAGSFLDDLKRRLERARSQKVLVFVHGYRVSFAEAARTIAQICFDLNFTGIPFLYSWPSRGNLFGYTRDEANAAWTRENFIKTMTLLNDLPDSVERHLLAHSMGHRIVFQGTQLLQGRHFEQMMLAAPDEDAGTLENQMDRFLGRAQRQTLYASSKDYALRASKWVHGASRGGQVGVAGLDTIDASAINFSRFGHSYFHDQRALLADMFLLIEHGHPPDQRPLIRRASESDIWLFQP